MNEETISNLKALLNTKTTVAITSGVLVGTVSFAAGFYLAKKKYSFDTNETSNIYDINADVEVELEYEEVPNISLTFTPDEKKAIEETFKRFGYGPTNETPQDVNIFEREEDPWDWDSELQRRAEQEGPYILHVDEFVAHETEDQGFGQETLTFYTEDSVIADSDDSPMKNWRVVLGSEFDTRFGYGSNDKSVVYVRSPDYQMEYEILLHDGSYAAEALGLTYEDIGE